MISEPEMNHTLLSYLKTQTWAENQPTMCTPTFQWLTKFAICFNQSAPLPPLVASTHPHYCFSHLCCQSPVEPSAASSPGRHPLSPPHHWCPLPHLPDLLWSHGGPWPWAGIGALYTATTPCHLADNICQQNTHTRLQQLYIKAIL